MGWETRPEELQCREKEKTHLPPSFPMSQLNGKLRPCSRHTVLSNIKEKTRMLCFLRLG
jgi:hypothetical protein